MDKYIDELKGEIDGTLDYHDRRISELQYRIGDNEEGLRDDEETCIEALTNEWLGCCLCPICKAGRERDKDVKKLMPYIRTLAYCERAKALKEIAKSLKEISKALKSGNKLIV